MSTGWLAQEPDGPDTLEGYRLDRATFPTRYEEFSFVLRTLAHERPGVAVDAGSGFNPEIHLLPYLLARRGWYTIATDVNPESLRMPGSDRVNRLLEDMSLGWSTRGLDADAWTCVSTLEHLQSAQQFMAIDTAFATLRPGGIAVVTTDFMAPGRLRALLRFGGFEVGPEAPLAGPHLVPRVAWGIGRKPLLGGDL